MRKSVLMDPTTHKEFSVSHDGSLVSVGSDDGNVCVLSVDDGNRWELAEVSYSFGGRRLSIDAENGLLFSGAYYATGIACYEIESGDCRWDRRDLKKVQQLALDSRNALLYTAFEDRASRPLNTKDGRERNPIKGLKGFHFSPNGDHAVFEFANVLLENRIQSVSRELTRKSWAVLDVAFTRKAAVVSWVGGPVVAYHAETGQILWCYVTEGTHAFCIAPASDGASIWLIEEPFKEPPWHRLRLLSDTGEIKQEVRCGLGHSFKLIPWRDKVICADMQIVDIDQLS